MRNPGQKVFIESVVGLHPWECSVVVETKTRLIVNIGHEVLMEECLNKNDPSRIFADSKEEFYSLLKARTLTEMDQVRVNLNYLNSKFETLRTILEKKDLE